MVTWYNSLNSIQHIFAYIAIPATAVLLIQTILVLLGIGDGDADADGDVETGDDGLMLFSVRGIVAMLCVGGWSGIALIETGMSSVLAITLAIICGIAAMLGISLIMKLLMKLQSNGNIELSGAIGKTGQVYLTIPPAMKGTGKVNIVLQDVYSECSAMTSDEKQIKTGELIRVVATDGVGMLIVERVNKETEEVSVEAETKV